MLVSHLRSGNQAFFPLPQLCVFICRRDNLCGWTVNVSVAATSQLQLTPTAATPLVAWFTLANGLTEELGRCVRPNENELMGFAGVARRDPTQMPQHTRLAVSGQSLFFFPYHFQLMRTWHCFPESWLSQTDWLQTICCNERKWLTGIATLFWTSNTLKHASWSTLKNTTLLLSRSVNFH